MVYACWHRKFPHYQYSRLTLNLRVPHLSMQKPSPYSLGIMQNATTASALLESSISKDLAE